jgi:UDP-N-acetyl-D-mannosaminuronic acid dehydrogenase
LAYKTLCVIGLGYIGLPTASTFATHSLNVIGVDTNPEIVEGLNNGHVHLFEPGLRTLVQAALQSGNLIVRRQPQPADAFIIAVPTPFKENKRADLSFVISAAESIVPHLREGNLVIWNPPLRRAPLWISSPPFSRKAAESRIRLSTGLLPNACCRPDPARAD